MKVAAFGAGGIRVESGNVVFEQARPVAILLASRGGRGPLLGYGAVEERADALVGSADVELPGDARLLVEDVWTTEDDVARCARTVRIECGGDDAFATSLRLARSTPASWAEVVPFAPGAIYGDAEPVARLSIGGAPERRRGVRNVLVREDRLAAPLFGARYPDGVCIAVLHFQPDATTTSFDGADEEGGETLVDERFGVLSLGGTAMRGKLEIGAWLPGSEGTVTYTSGGLPLRQVRRWRRRYHPLAPGTRHAYDVAFRLGAHESQQSFVKDAWRWAWRELAPDAEPVDTAAVVESGLELLAGETIVVGRAYGIPLDLDAVSGAQASPPKGVMGFVGANTDAAALLLRSGRRELGTQILDAFAELRLRPPEAEGFDLRTGSPATYRTFRGRPAVYARSLAEGCAAALEAWADEAARGVQHEGWLRWATEGGDWFLDAQRSDGSFPRAWEAGTGRALDESPTATYVAVPFLCSLARATARTQYLDAALNAGAFVWRHGGSVGTFAGATLDNPDVVDKEAAALSLEAFLALHDATGDHSWVDRAVVAADVAETWIYIWNVPMPEDADPAELHWKPSVPTVGQQLIATGVSMCDGFLAVNAAAFARLHELTGDAHYLDVARLVTHGTKAMYPLPGREFDLAGPGWQQEHWCLAIPRGKGLNRNWLPWVSVAHVKGILRLLDLGSATADRVLA